MAVHRLALVAAGVAGVLTCGGTYPSQASSGVRITARLTMPSVAVVAGQATTAAVTVSRGGRPVRGVTPRLRFVSEFAAVVATARPTGRAGRYTVGFRLPIAGVWTYRITIRGVVAGTGKIEARIDARLPGADAYAICDDAGPFWPTMTLALDFGSAWIACKARGTLARFDPGTSRRTATFRLGGSSLIAVATGFGSIWALDGTKSGTLIRIDPNRNAVTARIDLGTGRAYNVWTGAGAVWVAGDGTGEIVRIDPATNAVAARIAVGDGPADLVFQDTTVWVINHRDRGLVQIDAATNTARLVTTIPGDAPERMAFAAGRLWITGRGTDLVEVNPSSGDVLRTVEIGAGGIDVVAYGDNLWVPTRNAETDRRGFPTMEALRRVDPRAGAVTASLPARGQLDVHGLAVDERGVWLADNTHGVLYRVPG